MTCGVLDLRRMVEPIARGELQADSPLEPYLQPAVRVLETSTLAELLPMIRSGQPLLLVVDEHGGTEAWDGCDLTGEIVGDDLQEDTMEPELLQDEDQPGAWLAAGDLEIFELNRQLELDLPEADDHHTLAGFLLERLQHIPAPGEALRFNGMQFEITVMAGPRIERVGWFCLNRQKPMAEPDNRLQSPRSVDVTRPHVSGQGRGHRYRKHGLAPRQGSQSAEGR